jgi:hypothetical protein
MSCREADIVQDQETHMTPRNFVGSAAIAASMSLAFTVAAVPPPNDACSNAQAITGSGPFSWDLTEATTGPNGFFAQNCDAGVGISKDVWFCWTATCNGLVEFSTCGQTTVDTKIRIYQGCTCPGDVGQPICCSDNDCEKQTKVVCDVVCGETYLIQLGAAGNAPGGPGTLTITCLEADCGGDPDPVDCGCCGGRPPLVDQLSTPFNAGLVAATTNFQADPNGPAVYLVDLGNQGSAPLGNNWTTQRFSDPSWTMSKLGGVFGVALDDAGNVFVGHTSCYFMFANDPVGSLGGAGSVYRLDGTTGAATEVVRLPNSQDPFWVGQGQAGQAWPGLGNMSFDCGTRRLYVANLEDGRIYAIDPSNAVQPVRGTFDIATGAITGPLPTTGLAEPGDAPGWVPLGERPYAVKAQGGRIYYSVWAGNTFAGAPNSIRSVQIDGGGNFVASTDQLELVMPALPGNTGSNPVVDITFDDACCMLVAERGVDELGTSAHSSRVMKFCRDAAAGTGWDSGFTYSIGDASCLGPYNSAGGIGYEVGAGNVWSMGDALRICAGTLIYGLQGQPSAGTPIGSSVLVDLDGVTNTFQKNLLGSLDVTCLAVEPPCMTIEDGEILCREDGSFVYSFTLTNLSGETAAVLVMPDPSVTPNVVPLIPPLASGSSTTVNVVLNGPAAGSQFCFPMILGSIKGQECCHIDHCIELPDCECAQVSQVAVAATSTPGVFTLNYTLTNLEAWTMGHVVMYPTAAGISISPALVNVPATLPFGSQVVGPVTITTTAAPGSQICITIGNHSMNWLQCCFIELCVTVPQPSQSSNPADLDGDGDVDAADLAILLGNWGATGSGVLGDVNGDGVVDASDLALLLGSWGP